MKRTLPGLSDYWRLWRHSGLTRAWDYFWDNHFFDLLHGTDTAHWRPKSLYDQALTNLEHGFRYEASFTSVVHRAVSAVSSVVPLQEYGFFDLGCGKGKALLVAARHPFAAVHGVEYDSALADIARRNLAKSGLPGVVHVADAATFSGYTRRAVIYLYNPFDPVILSAVLDKISELEDVIAIYSNPVYAAAFDGWEKIGALPGRELSRSSLIFRAPAAR